MFWLVAGEHVSPVLGVMVRIDYGERSMVHVSRLRATGDVEKIEFHGFAIRRDFTNHAWPISGVTIMGQEQATPPR
jgi:hypothetical protein